MVQFVQWRVYHGRRAKPMLINGVQEIKHLEGVEG
jgi:hypothetical protein